MRVIKFRHFGIPCDDLETASRQMKYIGFDEIERCENVINGQRLLCAKFKNDQGIVIELIQGGLFHLAFTVDKVLEDGIQYYMVAPRGHKIQFHQGPGNAFCEMVEEPKGSHRKRLKNY